MRLEFQVTVHKQATSINSLLVFLSRPEILEILLACKDVAKSANDVVYVIVVGSKRMLALNSQYRQKQSSTDVLSFELHEQGVMGELYLSPDDIQANAKMMKHSFEEEFIEIFVHGILHLAGYDHEPEMFEWQKSLTERILVKYETNRRAR